MRFMIILKADAETEAGVLPTEELFAAMMKYNQEMVDAGVMLAGDGLHPSSRGARVKFHGGSPPSSTAPSPRPRSWSPASPSSDVASREEAIEWVRRWPRSDGHGEVEIEIRPLYEADDFGEAFTAGLRQQEEQLRARAAEQHSAS